MPLPTFIGLGAARSGTTWLHQILAAHPEIYMPTSTKEIYFFDENYDKGLGWYERFFPSIEDTSNYKALGEITPHYLDRAQCIARIAQVPTIQKFLLILRNPVDRAYSQYGLKVRQGGYSGSFEEFIKDWPMMLETGFYSQHLQRYLEYFSLDQFLILLYERAVADVADTKVKLANFLEVTPEYFPEEAGHHRVNRAYLSKHPTAYNLAVKLDTLLKKNGLHRVSTIAVKWGARKLFGNAGPLPPMSQSTRQQLNDLYIEDIEMLEKILAQDLCDWRL